MTDLLKKPPKKHIVDARIAAENVHNTGTSQEVNEYVEELKSHLLKLREQDDIKLKDL